MNAFLCLAFAWQVLSVIVHTVALVSDKKWPRQRTDMNFGTAVLGLNVAVFLAIWIGWIIYSN